MAFVNLIPGGINNKQDPIKLGQLTDFRDPSVRKVTSAVNIDLDDNNVATRRAGRTERLAISNGHSFWTTRNGKFAYFVQGGVLRRFNSDYTATSLAILSVSNPVHYEPVNDVVVYSNGVDIGILDTGAQYSFQAPETLEFKTAMSPGQYLGFYNGTLYAALGSTLFISDPYKMHQRDTRTSQIQFPGYIRMLAAVADGLYLATDKRVYFMQGGSSDDFRLLEISDSAPANGAFGYRWTDDSDSSTRLVYWVCPEGFCTGATGGRYANLSTNDVALPSGTGGHCFFREENGISQYIGVINDPSGGNTYSPETLNVSTINF
jgi:hypothetical protein